MAHHHEQQQGMIASDPFGGMGVGPQFDPDGTTMGGGMDVLGMMGMEMEGMVFDHGGEMHGDLGGMEMDLDMDMGGDGGGGEEVHVGLEDYLVFDDD